MNLEKELTKRIAGYRHDPRGFVRFAYPWRQSGELESFAGAHSWQNEVLDTVGTHLRGPDRFTPLLIAIASGHGIGKSALIAWLTHWGLSTCVDTRATITAGTGKQIETKTWPEITKWFKLGINAHWWDAKAESICARDVNHERTWRVDVNTWSLNNPGAFAGLHNAGKRIIIVYDESSTIDDVVWEVTSGALTDANTEIIWLAFGNPTENTGRFRECFGRYKHRWIGKQIDSRTVPGTNKELFQGWVDDYGEDSDYVRVRVRGEFPRAGSNQLISSELVNIARKHQATNYQRHAKVMSVDVARFGSNMTVIGTRQGPKLSILKRLRGMDTVQTGRHVIDLICQEQPRCCIIDGDGIGGGVVDYVNEYLADEWRKRFDASLPQTFFVQEFHGAIPPRDPFMYFNLRAECWGMMRDWLKTGDIPDDAEVEADLTGLTYRLSAKNQIQLERKEDMVKRGLASPDIGDMIAMSFAAQPAGQTEEEALRERLDAIKDPLWRHVQQVKATLDREQESQYDERPEWMREG